MNKKIEERYFRYVYGNVNGWQIQRTESPDFICLLNGEPVLGVEVTELYNSESDARLKNIPNYTMDLLNGGNFRHKDDKKHFKVEQVTLIKKGEKDGKKIPAVIQQPPNFTKRVTRLSEIVSDKEKRVKSYLKSCPSVDLVISDVSGLFSFNKYEEFFSPFSRLIKRNEIVNSKFREIFVVTSIYEGVSKRVPVKIPLKLNLFAEDITILEDLLRKSINTSATNKKRQLFIPLLYGLHKLGYRHISVASDKEGLGLTIGSHLFSYTKKGKTITEHTTTPERLPKGEPLAGITEIIDESNVELADAVLKQIRSFSCCMYLFMKIENV